MALPGKEAILQVASDVLRELTGEVRGGEPRRARGELISEREVRAAKARGDKVLVVSRGTIVTPLARDAAWECGVQLRFDDGGAATPAPTLGKDEVPGGPAPRHGGLIALGADHGGYELKEAIKEHLSGLGLQTLDMGTHEKKSCDYPDLAAAVARGVALGDASWGILVDGAGIGSCMAANKVPGVLAATCHDERTARNAREHNGSNVLCLGSGTLQGGAALRVVDAWLDTPFAGGRHGRRVNMIKAIERSFTRST